MGLYQLKQHRRHPSSFNAVSCPVNSNHTFTSASLPLGVSTAYPTFGSLSHVHCPLREQFAHLAYRSFFHLAAMICVTFVLFSILLSLKSSDPVFHRTVLNYVLFPG